MCSSVFRHQRLYSLLDRFRLMVAPDTTSPSPLVTSHPLDGEDQPALESVALDKVRLCLERVIRSVLAMNRLYSLQNI